jgi:thymidylate synthase
MHFRKNRVRNIRDEFARKFHSKEIVINESGSISGSATIEIVGASFIADENIIFGQLDNDYISREIAWYRSMSLDVNDISGKIPKIWQAVSGKHGEINSNYGFLVYSNHNGDQFENVIEELLRNRNSRRAIMIYTRPSMHVDWDRHGMTDFVCTNTVQYIIRNNRLDVIVQMRSNDAWAGYRNDLAWQQFVQAELVEVLNMHLKESISAGNITWQVGSLHIYESQFYLIDHFTKTGELHITKKDYNIKYRPHDT